MVTSFSMDGAGQARAHRVFMYGDVLAGLRSPCPAADDHNVELLRVEPRNLGRHKLLELLEVGGTVHAQHALVVPLKAV